MMIYCSLQVQLEIVARYASKADCHLLEKSLSTGIWIMKHMLQNLVYHALGRFNGLLPI